MSGCGSTRRSIRDAATVACLRDGPDALEVLLLRRASTHAFGPGAWVFPGGVIEDADRCRSDDMVRQRTSLAFDALALAARLAAIRETFEEAGLLVGVDYGHDAEDATSRECERTALAAGERDWSEIVGRLGVSFDPSALVDFGYRCTPPGHPRRFATRFFAAALDDRIEARCDGLETDAAEWWSPRAALAAAQAATIGLMSPTRHALEVLMSYDTVDTALADLRCRFGSSTE